MSVTTEYGITGMTCEHCERAVTDELQRLDGVEAVTVSAAAGTARVTSAAPLDAGAVRDAVAEAGYEVVDQ